MDNFIFQLELYISNKLSIFNSLFASPYRFHFVLSISINRLSIFFETNGRSAAVSFKRGSRPSNTIVYYYIGKPTPHTTLRTDNISLGSEQAGRNPAYASPSHPLFFLNEPHQIVRVSLI
jgi:hypothetical protein